MNVDDPDFKASARRCLGDLAAVVGGAARTRGVSDLAAMRVPIVQLKVAAAGDGLIVALSNMVLQFLDDVDDVDGGVLEIVGAYAHVFMLIVEKDFGRDDERFGEQIEIELNLARKRYFIKNPR